VNSSFVLVLLTGLGWGLLAPASKALFHDAPGLDGFSLAVARATWAFPFFLIMLALAWRANPPHLEKRRWAAAIGAGLVFGLVVSTVFTIAAQHTSIAHISFIVGITPVTNTVFAALCFRTRLDLRSLLALAFGVVGVVLLAFTQHGGSATMLGDSLMLVWLVGFAAYAILLRAIGPGVSSTFVMAFVGTISMGVLIVPGILLGYGHGILAVISSPLAGAWFFGEVVIGSTLVGQTAYAAAVRRLGVSLATIGAEYIALFVGVVASLATHEAWTPLTIVAGATFCVALAVTFAPLPFLKTAPKFT
jgi:drug/metabolite transporter (DMT)-like permease